MTKFSRTQKFTKANIENVPEGKAIVYKLKNAAGENLYTGIAGRGRGQDRLQEHKDLKREMIPGATKFQFSQVKNKDRAEQVEKQIIRKEQPKFNEQNK
ncbi:MAG: hypothetical protein UY23_C0004G0012 [Candidatus Jorgensenbacteria bacterium GW2011_GWA1_48_11]|uniref:GIY-YIG domain-containing protein n=1 Tax=Candidatus Jorgensenbacteria bacterium GW2011_GWA1_48_11 TaxID=1618660 RepID=A0A0G1UAB4_9BACT|nr:MAG: hypothetical protein UY23_C0004G0012 [Candidatus Jorgensenbacteria bacterium GW2011_GWA1_48_11]KKW11807.1 MAG: hypothetical protein UY51_C0005G0048 [Candidatus Jorgensenbacteria bacterium GW2011_GWB1_49_9]